MRRFLVILVLGLGLPGVAQALLDWHVVKVTDTGPQPSVIHVTAGFSPVVWQGSHGWRIVFADGSCRATVNDSHGCTFTIGAHPYRVLGLGKTGTVVASPLYRRVTLHATSGTLLTGTVDETVGSPPGQVTETVTLFAKAAGGAFAPIARQTVSGWAPLRFRFQVQPRRRTTYEAAVLTKSGYFGRTFSSRIAVG